MVSFISDRVRPALLFAASALALQACIHDVQQVNNDSPPDYTIPNLAKSQGKWRYGVTDTIAVEFSEKIDTQSLALTFTPRASIGYRMDGASRLLIFGLKQDAGTTHFIVNSPFTLDIAGLRGQGGNGRPAATESFQPYYWADRDFLDSSYQGFDSLFLDDSTWADSSRMYADTLISEGRLDFNGNGNLEDRQDFKLVRLTPPDTFKLNVYCPKAVNMRMQIAGPFASGSEDSILQNYSFPAGSLTFHADTNKTRGVLSYQFAADFLTHYNVLGSPAAPGLYAIRLSIPEDQEGFYRVVAVARRNRRP
ncbi:MAG: hypothetical protein JF616_05580 [Fibrobacteres bacterium]|nr:hypothetical protein [Fibrobacterota bacterium]